MLNRHMFLVASVKMTPERSPADLEVRPIIGNQEWEIALRNQHRSLTDDNDTVAFRRFQTAQLVRYRKMVEAGFGFWLGAFLAGRLVANMGIFGNRGLARCQAVTTDPDFRRRGIAEAMVRRACILAQESLGAETIVIMTEEESPARRLYERLGFQPVEHAPSLARAHSE